MWSEGKQHPRGRVKGHCVCLWDMGRTSMARQEAGGGQRVSHFWGMGCPFQTGPSGAPTSTLPSPGLWLAVCPLLCWVLGCDPRCPCPSYDAQSEQHWLVPTLPVFRPPWISLTFDIDLEAPAVLTTRRGHAAFPESTVPKSQLWHLELSCSPIWLYNGLGRLRETKKKTNQRQCTSMWQVYICRLTKGQQPGGSPSTISSTPFDMLRPVGRA